MRCEYKQQCEREVNLKCRHANIESCPSYRFYYLQEVEKMRTNATEKYYYEMNDIYLAKLLNQSPTKISESPCLNIKNCYSENAECARLDFRDTCRYLEESFWMGEGK